MQVIAEVAVGRPTLGNAAWIGITAVIVVAAYAVAIAVPNIWPVMVSSLFGPLCMNENTPVSAHSSCQSFSSYRQCIYTLCLRNIFLARSVGPMLTCPADYHGSHCSCGYWVDLPCMHHAENHWRQMLMAEEAWRLYHHPYGPVYSCGSSAQHHRITDPPVSLASV